LPQVLIEVRGDKNSRDLSVLVAVLNSPAISEVAEVAPEPLEPPGTAVVPGQRPERFVQPLEEPSLHSKRYC